MNVTSAVAVKYFPQIEPHCVRAVEADPLSAARLVSGKEPLVGRINAFQRLSNAAIESWTAADPESNSLAERRRRTLAFYGLVCATSMIDWPDNEIERMLGSLLPYTTAIIAA